jgi:hypothetical protein
MAVLRELSGADAARWLWRYKPRWLNLWFWQRPSGPCIIMRSSRTRYYFGYCGGLSPRHGAHERDRLHVFECEGFVAWVGERFVVIVTRDSLRIGHHDIEDVWRNENIRRVWETLREDPARLLKDVVYALQLPPA